MATISQSTPYKLAQVQERFVRNHVKTRMCTFFLQNKCTRGSSCKFAHNQRELRSAPDYSKTRFCEVFFQTGVCPTGETCQFAHSQEELRVRDPSKAPQLPSGPFGAASLTAAAVPTPAPTAWVATPSSTVVLSTPAPTSTGRPAEEESKDRDRERGSSISSDSDSDSDSDSEEEEEEEEEEEPLVTKNLTASTVCSAATGRRRSWADLMEEDEDGSDFDEYCESWSSSGAGGLSSLSAATDSEASFFPSPSKESAKVGPTINDVEDEEEIVVEYVVKRSFFHLQPASSNPRFAKFRSASLD